MGLFMSVNCASAEADIRVLQNEKTDLGRRVGAGVSLPLLVVVAARATQYLTVYFFASRQAEKAFLKWSICAADVFAAVC
jgi:hypothetical protein